MDCCPLVAQVNCTALWCCVDHTGQPFVSCSGSGLFVAGRACSGAVRSLLSLAYISDCKNVLVVVIHV